VGTVVRVLGAVTLGLFLGTGLLLLTHVSAWSEDEGPPSVEEEPAWAKVAPEQIAEAKKHDVPVAFENDLGMRFVLIPAGTFLMGSPEDEEGREDDEKLRQVTITRPYYMQATEVTNGQYRHVFPKHRSGMCEYLTLDGDHQPAVRLTWGDADAYVEQLSERDELRSYRLPTEAEWEHASRAGSKETFWWGGGEESAGRCANVADLAWTHLTYSQPEIIFKLADGYAVSAPVGSFEPSPWGLWDMIGNVWELCADWYAEYPIGRQVDPTGPTVYTPALQRVARGGAWSSPAKYCRCAVRWTFPGSGGNTLGSDVHGLRLVSPLSGRGHR